MERFDFGGKSFFGVCCVRMVPAGEAQHWHQLPPGRTAGKNGHYLLASETTDIFSGGGLSFGIVEVLQSQCVVELVQP